MSQASQQEKIFLGELVGELPLFQTIESIFYEKCKQENSKTTDSTGLRIYGGSHVLIRFLRNHLEILNEKRVCEIGCGIGAVGLSCALFASPSCLVLTDGNPEAIAITSQNAALLNVCDRVTISTFLWDRENLGSLVCHDYDILIGCELMYYKLEMTLLIDVVRTLLKETGIFIHAHRFRISNQEQELIDTLSVIGWKTVEIPLSSFIGSRELSEHPEWQGVRCLLSGSSAALDGLISLHPSWFIFTHSEESLYEFVFPGEG
jgi:predicted nicotinamide N-methyase